MKLLTSKCLCCGRTYAHKRREAQYCGQVCRNKAYRERKRRAVQPTREEHDQVLSIYQNKPLLWRMFGMVYADYGVKPFLAACRGYEDVYGDVYRETYTMKFENVSVGENWQND